MPFADRDYICADSPASLFPHLVGLPDDKLSLSPDDVNNLDTEHYLSTRRQSDICAGSMAGHNEQHRMLPLIDHAKEDHGYMFNIIDREDRYTPTLTDHIHNIPAHSSTNNGEGTGPPAVNTPIVQEQDQQSANTMAYQKNDNLNCTSTSHEEPRLAETVTIPGQTHPVYTPTPQNDSANATPVSHPMPLKYPLHAEPPPSASQPPSSIPTPPQVPAAATAAPEKLSNPIDPTPEERLATYDRYISSVQHTTRVELRAWFEITYQRPLTNSQASSIIHTKGMVPRVYNSTTRKHVPRFGFTYDAALERERVIIYEYTMGITRAESRAPTMARVSGWWAAQNGGRLLAANSIAGMVAEMRRRGGHAMAVEAAKNEGREGPGEWEAMDLSNRKEFVKAGMKRAHEEEEEEDGEVVLKGPWCKPGEEAEEAKEATGRRRHQKELVNTPKKGKRRVKIRAPPRLQCDDEEDGYPDISSKLWSWWRKHRDPRRISTNDLRRRAGLFWANLGNVNVRMPDFTDHIEWFKNRYQLVTNEGGPYMEDMAYMYDLIGTDLPMRPPNRSQIGVRRWC